MMFTVLGDRGFIGSHLMRELHMRGIACQGLPRDYRTHLETPLGHVIYCVGVTGDFRWRPLDTVDAHVCHLLPLLREGQFDSLIYLSSTRVYGPSGRTQGLIGVDPANADHLYNATKIAGESVCLTAHPDRARVLRLSNVYGDFANSPNFLNSIVQSALVEHTIELATSLDTARDYVWIDDIIETIIAVATRGRRNLYDVGSGVNRTTAELVAVLQRETGCSLSVEATAPTVTFPPIDVSPLRQEFDYAPRDVLEMLPRLVASMLEKGSIGA